MSRNSFVCEQTDHNIAIFCTLIDDVYQPRMHNIAYHAKINCFFLFHHISLYFLAHDIAPNTRKHAANIQIIPIQPAIT